MAHAPVTMSCANITRVKYLDSRNGTLDESWIGDEGLAEKIPDIATAVKIPFNATSATLSGPLIVITTQTKWIKELGMDQIEISSPTLGSLLSASGFPPQLATVYQSRQAHMSRHTHYDDRNEKAVAISILIRAPRNSQVVFLAMRIRLQDRACVALISTAIEQTGLCMRARCIAESDLLRNCPLYLVLWLFEDRIEGRMRALLEHWDAVGDLESRTRMAPPSWLKQNVIAMPSSFAVNIEDPESLLQGLHAVNTELLLAQSVTSFSEKLGRFCQETFTFMEGRRDKLGLEGLKLGVRASFVEQTEFVQERCHHCSEKTKELLSRVQIQINASFGLIAQQDSRVNLFLAGDSRRIAILAARDSQTMKTITIITMVFLPSTLVASIWSANIFKLDMNKSWWIFVLTSFCFTASVFSVWQFFRLKLGSRQELERNKTTNLYIPGVGNVSGGRVLSPKRPTLKSV